MFTIQSSLLRFSMQDYKVFLMQQRLNSQVSPNGKGHNNFLGHIAKASVLAIDNFLLYPSPYSPLKQISPERKVDEKTKCFTFNQVATQGESISAINFHLNLLLL